MAVDDDTDTLTILVARLVKLAKRAINAEFNARAQLELTAVVRAIGCFDVDTDKTMRNVLLPLAIFDPAELWHARLPEVESVPWMVRLAPLRPLARIACADTAAELKAEYTASQTGI